VITNDSRILIIFLAEETWTGNWFPHNPNDTPEEPVKNTTSSEKWSGKWYDQEIKLRDSVKVVMHYNFLFLLLRMPF
jgi:hypothetical protein